MKWFFKWIRSGLDDLKYDEKDAFQEKEWVARAVPAMAGNRKNKLGLNQVAVSDSNRVNLSTNPMNFRIYQASGGHVVEYQYYDEKMDVNHQALHLIPSDLDMGSELAKILTLEALKR